MKPKSTIERTKGYNKRHTLCELAVASCKFILFGLIILSLTFPIGILEGAEFNPGSEPDGFRGMKWGTDISTLKDMEFMWEVSKHKLKAYIKKDDDLKIGEAQLARITYIFWDGKFEEVKVYPDGYSNYQRLRKAIFDKFGIGESKPFESLDGENYKQYYTWDGPITHMDLSYEEGKKEGKLSLISIEVFKKQFESYK